MVLYSTVACGGNGRGIARWTNERAYGIGGSISLYKLETELGVVL